MQTLSKKQQGGNKEKTKKTKTSNNKTKAYVLMILKYIKKGFFLFLIISISSVILFRFVNPPITPLMVIRNVEDGEQIDKKWVPLDKISPNIVGAVIASEDQKFKEHYGFDFESIQKVYKQNKKHKTIKGASTISQQTAKNVFLWQGRSWLRKGLEVYFTTLIELIWSKERIMEVYLNVIEMGRGLYGAEAASMEYFKKNASDLNKKEASLIVACLPNPRKWTANKPSNYISKKSNWISARIWKFKNL